MENKNLEEKTRGENNYLEKDLATIQKKLDSLKYETLKSIDLFSAFPEPTLKLLVKHCKDIQLKDDEILCKEGAMEKSMYIILSGELLIYRLKRKIDIAGPGEYLGEMLLIDSKPRSASVKAKGEVLLMEIDDDIFNKYIMSDPLALHSMLETFCGRTRKHLKVITDDFQKLNIFVHDMRNILYGLNIPEIHMESLVKILEGTGIGQQARAGFNEAKSSLDKLATIKSNLINLLEQSLAITNNVNSEYVREGAPILPLVKETIDELVHHKHLMDKNIQIDCTTDSPEAPINYLDIKRVMQNLIINAGQASEKQQDINISIRDRGDSIQISVKDQGSGIPDDIKPFLFKEQYTSKSEGHGFGLLSCRSIIEDNHGGKFWFDSEENKGSTFYFTLPN